MNVRYEYVGVWHPCISKIYFLSSLSSKTLANLTTLHMFNLIIYLWSLAFEGRGCRSNAVHFRAFICIVLRGAPFLLQIFPFFNPNYWRSQWEVNRLINYANKRNQTSFNVNLVLLIVFINYSYGNRTLASSRLWIRIKMHF